MYINLKQVSTNHFPVSFKLRELNKDLQGSEYNVILFELDGIGEMLVHYVHDVKEIALRIDFIDTFMMFLNKYQYGAVAK